MKLRTLALAAVVLALSLPVFAAKSPMKPGKWQITMTMEMANMPAMPPMTFTNCVTKEQAENPQPPKRKDQNCELKDYKIDGNTVTWSVQCTGKMNATGEGKMTFNGDSYEGTTHMKMNDMDMTQHFTGKYLGDCDK